MSTGLIAENSKLPAMLAMENAPRCNKSSNVYPSSRQWRSGYEPSDTETDWQESPWHEGLLISNRSKTPDPVRNISPLNRSQRHTSKESYVNSAAKASRTSQELRRSSRSPYKPTRDGDDGLSSIAHPDLRRSNSPFEISEHRNKQVSPYKARRAESNHGNNMLHSDPRRNKSPFELNDKYSDTRRNTSPFGNSEHRSKNISPYKVRRDENQEFNGSFHKRNQKTPPKVPISTDKRAHSQPQEVSTATGRSYIDVQEDSGLRERSKRYHTRSMSAPKPRAREKEQQVTSGSTVHGADQRPSLLPKAMICEKSDVDCTKGQSSNEVNEIIASLKLSKSPSYDALMMPSTESIPNGDIFFSRDCTALQKDSTIKKNDNGSEFNPQFKPVPETHDVVHQLRRGSRTFDQTPQAALGSTVHSRINTSSSSAAGQLSNCRSSNYSGKLSDSSTKLSGNWKKFTANRQVIQKDGWLFCVKGGVCSKSKSSDSRAIDEASFIERALVVEELRLFWADKHSPRSLSGFICHKQQAHHLKQLISYSSCPHILFKGPSGSGKKSLSMALLHELFGDSSWNVSHNLRHFHVQETKPVQTVIPLTSSPHHVELNLKSESKNARYALMTLVKEIADNRAANSDISNSSFKADYKVIILYDVDKAAETIQHLIKWIMDRYTEACKIILCCEDDTNILDSVKSRCKLVPVDPPVTHEIMEVLLQIAKKESFELSMSFAARIATKSKQNMRKAIMALEACKAHNYPFIDEQPIPLDWEDVLMEITAEVLADPSSKRLFIIRGKFQKLLLEFVPPKLILQKLVEQFLKGIEAGLKRELYYWHAYYDKRLPIGTSALLKLEEFVAKFMSIHRRSRAAGLQIV